MRKYDATPGSGNWTARSFSPELSGGTFPNKMHAVWMLREMIRWGHLHPDANILEIADRCCDTTAYRAAATSLGVGCPENDFITMELRGGQSLRLEDVRGKRPIIRRAVPGVELKTETRSRPPARVA